MGTRWQSADAPRGDAYDARWTAMAARGQDVHGEADLVESMLSAADGKRVLDAGCGTGRVAIELARRGCTVIGVDADAEMLMNARAKAPELHWLEADLADMPGLEGGFDVIVLAGNVMIFVAPGTEGTVLKHLGSLLGRGGVLVAGFQLRPNRLSLAEYDRLCAAAGLELAQRWATWDREPYAGGDYAVSVHRLQADQP